MMKPVIYLIFVILYMFMGACSISSAIDRFKRERYGLFGWHVMIAIWMTAALFRIVFKCM